MRAWTICRLIVPRTGVIGGLGRTRRWLARRDLPFRPVTLVLRRPTSAVAPAASPSRAPGVAPFVFAPHFHVHNILHAARRGPAWTVAIAAMTRAGRRAVDACLVPVAPVRPRGGSTRLVLRTLRERTSAAPHGAGEGPASPTTRAYGRAASGASVTRTWVSRAVAPMTLQLALPATDTGDRRPPVLRRTLERTRSIESVRRLVVPTRRFVERGLQVCRTRRTPDPEAVPGAAARPPVELIRRRVRAVDGEPRRHPTPRAAGVEMRVRPVDVVYRSPREREPTPAPAPARLAPGAPPAPPEINIDRVSRDVMRQIDKHIRIERERRGLH